VAVSVGGEEIDMLKLLLEKIDGDTLQEVLLFGGRELAAFRRMYASFRAYMYMVECYRKDPTR
tara:strand:+ start:1810 stop:1998 length:189 start_codon:yes stop_codon:yes gene_type:complete